MKKKLNNKDYKELYRRFKTQQYTLTHKGYAVYNYTFDEFVDIPSFSAITSAIFLV